ncbi:MAG: branched-chain amino acid ABC transporter permease [Actinobacteria bacterium]|nr:branched-chain amino acid ABC transporter permease [Actinomycetota bacterium]
MSATATDTAELGLTPEAPASRPRSFIPTRNQLLGLAGLAVISLLPVPFGDFGFFVGQYAAVYAMIALSIVILTGYGGLISVMQYSFAGVGAIITGVAMASWGWPFWIALPLAALATVPVAAVVGMIAVRLKGFYLAIATLTFANALGETLFRWERVTGGQSGWLVERPAIGSLSFASDVPFYLLCLGVVLLLVWMMDGLRTSRIGRAMLAVKDNELEAQALGINVFKTKLAAFVISGIVAGIGGSFLAVLLTSVTPTAFQSPFSEFTSIVLLSLVVIGGINRAIGAFFGAITLVVTQQVFAGAECFYSFVAVYSAAVLILFVLFRPGGLVEVGQRLGALVRWKPVVGIAVILVVLGINIGGSFFFVNAC